MFLIDIDLSSSFRGENIIGLIECGGILRALLAGVFSSIQLDMFNGYRFAKGKETMLDQLGVQFIGVIAIFTYTAIAS